MSHFFSFCLILRKLCSSTHFLLWLHKKKKKQPKTYLPVFRGIIDKGLLLPINCKFLFIFHFLSLVFKLLPPPPTKKIRWRTDFWRYRYRFFMLTCKSRFLLPGQIPVTEDFLHHPNFYSFALFKFLFCRPMCIPTVMLSSIWKAKGIWDHSFTSLIISAD